MEVRLRVVQRAVDVVVQLGESQRRLDRCGPVAP